MITVQHLSKHYGTLKAVDDISFAVKDKENLILLGTSGCGKTTTLKMLNKLIVPAKGTILIDGKDINDQPPEILRRSIGYVLQNTGLFPHYTIAENIAVVPKLLKWKDKQIADRTHELLGKLHLPASSLNQYPGQLSGGQQQRVGLARALITNPPVLLMDEPFGALDNITRAKIQAEFKALDELTRKTIVMVTHDVQEAFELADRICLMDQGRIVQIGTPKELLFNPVNDFVRGFLDAQRMQLEFKTITLIDIWGRLAAGEAGQPQDLSGDSTVWDAMAAFGDKRHQTLTAKNGEESKLLTYRELMSAFHEYQQQPKA